MGIPVYYCLGNHDLLKGEYGEKMFEDLFGPVYYSFESGNIHFVVTPMLRGDHKPGFTKEDVYRWLKNDLDLVTEEKSVIIFNHSILSSKGDFIYGINEDEKIILPDHKLIAWIYGHSHTNITRDYDETGVISVCTAAPNKGGIDHTPSCFRVFQVDQKNNLSMETRYTYLDRHLVITVPVSDHSSVNQQGKITVSAQVYHSSSPTEKVEFSIYKSGEETTWRPMKKKSDWTWHGEWDPGQVINNTELIVAAKARFTDGIVTRKQHEFIYTEKGEINPRPGESWPQFQGNPEHTGISCSEITPPLHLTWTRNVEANIWMSSPIVAQGMVFTASIDDDNRGRSYIYALDATSGELLWKYKTKNSVKGCIAFCDGKVLATDLEGTVYAISAENGNLVWKKDLGIRSRAQEGTIVCNNKVYTGGGMGLHALNASDGSEIWRNTSWSGGAGTIAPHMLGNHVLVASANWRQLCGHNALTGELLWSHRDDTLRFRDGTATLHGESLYLISRQNLLSIDPKTGKILNSKHTPYNFKSASTPVIIDEYLIVGTGDKGLVAFNKTSFEEVWRFETGPALFMTIPYARPVVRSVDTSPVISGDVVYFGASDGWFYGLDSRTGKEFWKIELGAPVFTSPAVSGNMIFIADFSGNIYAFSGSKNK
jgi:outer membrane protein assembly factor BamB